MFPVIQVPDDASDLTEQMGTKPKFWFRDEAGRQCLFKEGRPNTGESWAEKVCCELCTLLQIPHAHYDFAMWRGRTGVVSPTFVPDGGRLVHGNELLAKIVAGYEREKRFRARQHTVAVVIGIMRVAEIGMPVGYVPSDRIKSAAAVFVGYLMLDALVGNQDRHHENWGLILLGGQGVSLVPTFDHASSLGRNETDEVRVERLATRDKGRSIEAYVERARSALYASPASAKPLTTLAAFQEAAKLVPEARQYWLERLAATELADYEGIFENIPPHEITDPARDFALKMLALNRGRLLRSIEA
jgi:hypothetical protein